MANNQSQNLTRNQALVYDALCAADQPMSAYGLLDQLKPKGLKAPLQIYRCLDKLQQSGLVHKLESLNAFMACQHPDHETHLAGFAICDNCDKVEEFHHHPTEEALGAWAQQCAFTLKSAAIELRGVCAHCQDND